jgi:hypothetical protein
VAIGSLHRLHQYAVIQKFPPDVDVMQLIVHRDGTQRRASEA